MSELILILYFAVNAFIWFIMHAADEREQKKYEKSECILSVPKHYIFLLFFGVFWMGYNLFKDILNEVKE